MSLAFDPNSVVPALVGGALIGAGSALLLLLNGRIAGISGIVGGMLPPVAERGHLAWRLAFLVGLIGAPLMYVAWRGSTVIQIDAPHGLLLLAGALVGFGTRLGGGCTSGHGVCGTARLSPRSLVATGVFMAAGIAVVALVRHNGWLS